MLEVGFDLRRGGQICLPRIIQPEAPAQVILDRPGWFLPHQQPLRDLPIYSDQSRFVGTLDELCSEFEPGRYPPDFPSDIKDRKKRQARKLAASFSHWKPRNRRLFSTEKFHVIST
jgi:hypothetical protein